MNMTLIWNRHSVRDSFAMIFSHPKPSNYYQLKIPTRNVSNTFAKHIGEFVEMLLLCTRIACECVKKFQQSMCLAFVHDLQQLLFNLLICVPHAHTLICILLCV